MRCGLTPQCTFGNRVSGVPGRLAGASYFRCFLKLWAGFFTSQGVGLPKPLEMRQCPEMGCGCYMCKMVLFALSVFDSYFTPLYPDGI